MTKTKNDIYWELIFEKYKIADRILSDGYLTISATEINKFREARLMTKFDHRSQLPKLFSEHHFSILPIEE
ncbi:type II restriction enzyme [Viscerimonas tarda]